MRLHSAAGRPPLALTQRQHLTPPTLDPLQSLGVPCFGVSKVEVAAGARGRLPDPAPCCRAQDVCFYSPGWWFPRPAQRTRQHACSASQFVRTHAPHAGARGCGGRSGGCSDSAQMDCAFRTLAQTSWRCYEGAARGRARLIILPVPTERSGYLLGWGDPQRWTCCACSGTLQGVAV